MCNAPHTSCPIVIATDTSLLFLIWQTLSGARDTLFKTPPVQIVAVILLSVGVHLFYLGVNYVVVW